MFVPNIGPRYSEDEARIAIAASLSYAEALRRLAMCTTGGNRRTLKKYVTAWQLPVDHFDPDAARRRGLRRMATPLSEVLVENSTYGRGHLKARLYSEGLRHPVCELCGQGEDWRGAIMGLILDHINGVRDDNRLENLRIVCPNCAATLDTHCGRANRRPVSELECLRCGAAFRPRQRLQSYCSRECGQRSKGNRGARPGIRRVERPPYEQLLAEIAETSWSAVGRNYGVSDNAVRKWVRSYERGLSASGAARTIP